MGTYIEGPDGESFKLCTADDIHAMHDQVIQWKREGWTKQSELTRTLEDPNSLFEIEAYLIKGEKERLKRLPNYTHRRPRPLVIVNTIQGDQMMGTRFEHKPVIVQLQGLRASVYVYTDLECQQKGFNVYAKIAGFRLNPDGSTRTIFECDNCNAFFSLPERDCELVRKDNPEWAHLIKPKPTE